MSVSTTYKTACAFKLKNPKHINQSHIILETLKLPDLVRFLQSDELTVQTEFEYVEFIEFTDEKGKKEKLHFDTLKNSPVDLSLTFANASMYGHLEKKSRSWTEYLKVLWNGSATWKRKFYVLTNVGLLVYPDD